MKQISLKAARTNKNLKLEDAAEKIGVSVPTLSSWETGKTMPNLKYIKPILETYDVGFDDIDFCACASD